MIFETPSELDPNTILSLTLIRQYQSYTQNSYTL